MNDTMHIGEVLVLGVGRGGGGLEGVGCVGYDLVQLSSKITKQM